MQSADLIEFLFTAQVDNIFIPKIFKWLRLVLQIKMKKIQKSSMGFNPCKYNVIITRHNSFQIDSVERNILQTKNIFGAFS